MQIHCDLNRQSVAPFWRINDSVYELFHIPTYFEIINYSFLTVPVADRSLSQPFQCVTINHLEDPVTENPGLETILKVDRLSGM